jgi:hypothetical protein
MQPEDVVVVLRGGFSPFILRKKADSYWLIGEAYMHGMMYGEAVQMDRSRGGSEVVFHVRRRRLGMRWDVQKELQKHTTAGIRQWLPAELLIRWYIVCLWLSGREA